MNWIKTHQRHSWALLGAAMILAGILAQLPRSPWTLVFIGAAILFVVLISLMPSDVSPK
jgi:uncharacterized membrane protein YccC